MHEWDTFAVIVGGSAGALVGLLFVAISIHAGRIAEAADLRGRAAQTLVIFAALLLIALLLAIPEQSQRVLGGEFLVLAVLVAVALILLDRLARNTDSPREVANAVKNINPSTLTALGIAIAGGLMVAGVEWADFVLVPVICAAMVGGLASAYLLLTKLTD
ncbi:hypothetical protein [Mycolicibacterium moriokaense]|uniref:Modulator of FtsH protease n=1 Tax=Mycolicibacterium moriokaense TaxID=39691 RepID=A0A318HF52_9MYCO|nr:hypothetical protein [Mycolicibacterium moriokaense]PXX07713.1 hypothetical protein C8E89_11099 [Mycolicibacterium moriokaense]